MFFAGERTPSERFDASDGSIYRMVASFRDDGTPEAFFTMGRGISGEPTSPHWDDLHADWVETRFRRLRYLDAEVDDGALETIRLDP